MKRKTGAEDAPCAMEILQELLDDMQIAAEKEDAAASHRIYNRFLAERETGVVSRFFKVPDFLARTKTKTGPVLAHTPLRACKAQVDVACHSVP